MSSRGRVRRKNSPSPLLNQSKTQGRGHQSKVLPQVEEGGSPKRRQRSRPRSFVWRFRSAEFIVYALFILLGGRALVIQMFSPSETTLKRMAMRQYTTAIPLGNYRGTIFDRRGTPLALSVKNPSLAINPRIFSPSPQDLKRLSRVLPLSVDALEKISKKSNYFAWLVRHSTHNTVTQVMSWKLPGVYVIDEPSRYYPTRGVSAHIIGKVSIDNGGVLGLERLFDETLSGADGELVAVRDGRGQLILQDVREALPEKSGKDLHITLDHVIQEIVHNALSEGVEKAGARGGFALVGDPYTGAILALSSVPYYDPHARAKFKMSDTKNKAISDIFEPGSVVKPFVVAEALEKGLASIDEIHELPKSGVYRFPGGRVRDDHPKESLTTAELLVHSSNIGTVHLAERLGPEALWMMLRRLGMGAKPPQVRGLGPIVAGSLTHYQRWRPIRFANVSFGQGFSLNGLDLLRMYNIIASGGKMTPLHLVNKITHSDEGHLEYRSLEQSETLYSPEIMAQVSGALHRVSIEGTGRLAASKSYTVAGKSGTSEKYDSEVRGYSKDKRLASFAGYAPYRDPRITVVVLIDEPAEKPYYGGRWAAPVFREIVDQSLAYLNIPPDITREYDQKIPQPPLVTGPDKIWDSGSYETAQVRGGPSYDSYVQRYRP